MSNNNAITPVHEAEQVNFKVEVDPILAFQRQLEDNYPDLSPDDKQKQVGEFAYNLQKESTQIVAKAFKIGDSIFGEYSRRLYDETKSSIEKTEEIDIETFVPMGRQVLIKYDNQSVKLTKQFFDELKEKGLDMITVEQSINTLQRFGTIDQKYTNFIDDLRRRVGFVDYARTKGVLISKGVEAFKIRKHKVNPDMTTEVYYEEQPTQPQIGQTVYTSKESGYTYRDKDNNLYRLMEDHCINGLVK